MYEAKTTGLYPGLWHFGWCRLFLQSV